MANIINPKLFNNGMIKKIFSIMILFCLLMFSGYSVFLETSQTSNIRDYTLSEKGNTFIYSVVGTINDTISFTSSNSTYNYDWDLEISETTQPFFLRITNFFANTTGTFIYHGDLTSDDTAYVQPFTMEEVGTYYFQFTPTFENEATRVYLDLEREVGCVGSTCFTSVWNVYYTELKPMSFNTLIGGLVDGFVDIINLNIMAWQIGFYLILFIVTLLFTISIFGIAFLIFKYVKRLKQEQNGGV